MRRLVLWRLNRCVAWDRDDLLRALGGGGLFGPRHSVRHGDRNPFNQVAPAPVERSALGELMHEGYAAASGGAPAWSEYFVPIAVKCIGDPVGFRNRLGGSMTAAGAALFERILDAYSCYFGGQGVATPWPWKSYWTASSPPDSMGMNTSTDGTAGVPPYLGLYELMQLERQAAEKCVLVGYSQGGLVARFLAFMDEHLFAPEHQCIEAVLTAQSPLYGSPLARNANSDSVAEGLFRAVGGAAGVPSPVPFAVQGAALKQLVAGTLPSPFTQGTALAPAGHAPSTKEFDIDAVVALLDAAAVDAVAFPATERKQREAGLSFVLTARKWLSGLSTYSGTAFNDLDTESLDLPYTVLNCIHAYPLARIRHGSIIGANNRVNDFIKSGMPWWLKLFANKLLNGFASRLDDVEEAYRSGVMLESAFTRPTSVLGPAAAQRYADGAVVHGTENTTVAIGKGLHDFIIPSAYQASGPLAAIGAPLAARPPNLLGNVLNARAAHISGSEADGPASDAGPIAELLGRLSKQLTN